MDRYVARWDEIVNLRKRLVEAVALVELLLYYETSNSQIYRIRCLPDGLWTPCEKLGEPDQAPLDTQGQPAKAFLASWAVLNQQEVGDGELALEVSAAWLSQFLT